MTTFATLTKENFKPETLRSGEPSGNWIFAFPEDPEVLVRDDQGAPCQGGIARANHVLANAENLKSRAIKLLESFMKDRGTWYLSTVDCGSKARVLEADFVLSFVFEADRDLHEYGYTYFDVCFVVHENAPSLDRNGRPIKFVVGFH